MKNNRLIYLLIIVLIAWCTLLSTSVSKKTEPAKEIVNEYNVTGISTDFTKVVASVKDSIVRINSNGTISTGFIYKQIDDSVYIISSYHGVSESVENEVFFANGFSYKAEIIGYDSYIDMAILKIEFPYKVNALPLGDASLTKAGEFVVNIGSANSNEFDNSVELGMVSRSVKTIQNSITIDKKILNYCLDVIQLSSNLKTGFSGSPVINMNGEVIGMITMSNNSGNNMAIVSNEIRIVADAIINNQSHNKRMFGIIGSFINDMPLFEKTSLNLPLEVINGLYIESIADDSIAYNTDLKNGDVIISINGKTINNINDYYEIEYSDSSVYDFGIIRNGEPSSIKLEIND